MKPSILLLALTAIAVTSCTSAYKSGQTPDDVYFSPQRTQVDNEEYVNVDNKDEEPGYYNGDDYYGDRYLQMKVRNRYQWSGLDDYYYNDRYAYGFGGYSGYSYYNSLYWNNPWSPVSYWNYYYNPYYSSFYNPYYSPVVIIGSKYPNYYNSNYTVSSRPRTFNLNTYNSSLLNNNNTGRRVEFNNRANVNANRYNGNYRNTNSSAGDYLRNTFGGNNNSSRSTNSGSYNNSNSSSSSGGSRSSGSSSSSSSSAPVRRF